MYFTMDVINGLVGDSGQGSYTPMGVVLYWYPYGVVQDTVSMDVSPMGLDNTYTCMKPMDMYKGIPGSNVRVIH